MTYKFTFSVRQVPLTNLRAIWHRPSTIFHSGSSPVDSCMTIPPRLDTAARRQHQIPTTPLPVISPLCCVHDAVIFIEAHSSATTQSRRGVCVTLFWSPPTSRFKVFIAKSPDQFLRHLSHFWFCRTSNDAVDVLVRLLTRLQEVLNAAAPSGVPSAEVRLIYAAASWHPQVTISRARWISARNHAPLSVANTATGHLISSLNSIQWPIQNALNAGIVIMTSASQTLDCRRLRLSSALVQFTLSFLNSLGSDSEHQFVRSCGAYYQRLHSFCAGASASTDTCVYFRASFQWSDYWQF